MMPAEDIENAKEVLIDLVLDNFNWEVDRRGMILCPSAGHIDHNPGVAINRKNNTCRCFVCGSTFDTVSLYRSLSEKQDGRDCSFPQAVKQVLTLDGQSVSPSPQVYKPSCQNGSRANQDLYDIVLQNSTKMQGYELNYLHSRGIFIYDTIVYKGRPYTVQMLDKMDKMAVTEKDADKLKELDEIRNQGKLYHGIHGILEDNRIMIRHNFYKGVNSIIYQIEYEEYEDDTVFLADSERRMMVKKTLDSSHQKYSLGEISWNWIADGIGGKAGDIYICEGMEDAMSFTQNREKAVSLNSLSQLSDFQKFLEDEYRPRKDQRFIMAFDHDDAGRDKTKEMEEFFEKYNEEHKHKYRWYPYQYAKCIYPEEFHDINDYWKSKVNIL